MLLRTDRAMPFVALPPPPSRPPAPRRPPAPTLSFSSWLSVATSSELTSLARWVSFMACGAGGRRQAAGREQSLNGKDRRSVQVRRVD